MAQSEPVSPPQILYANGKQLARRIFLESMASIDVRHAMLSQLERQKGALAAGDLSIPLRRPPRVVAFGKAAARMTAALVEILGGEIEIGVVVTPVEPEEAPQHFRSFVGGHPYPTAGSLAGARAALEILSGLTTDDVVIFLISGGGSALFELPSDPAMTLEDLVEFNRLLVTCGLPIEQINVLRKHISAVKGGRLSARAHPARQLTIYISDVPEHLPSMIASGPTMPDESTVEECYALADRHGLVAKFPAAIRRRFEQRRLEETPKPGDPRFSNSQYLCLLQNRDVVNAAKSAAERMGFWCEIDSNPWDRDYRELAEASLSSLGALARAHPSQPVCLVAGGEVICPVTGPGVGGRNQAFVLYATQLIAGQQRVVLSAGTDGRDGNSPATGALADGETLSRAQALGLDPLRYLAESDSYRFFHALGDALDIGLTDNNVRDLRVWLHFG